MLAALRLLIAVLAGLGTGLASPLARAQDWPAHTVHIVVPFPPGGPTDVLGRLVGQAIGEVTGQAVVVENKTGAAGNIGVAALARAAPDGTTMGVVPAGNIAVNPAPYADLPYRASELAPVTLLAFVENVLVVNADKVPDRTLAELLTRARANPGTLSYASPGAGSQAHLAGALLEQDTGVKLVHVPYRGIAPAVSDLVGGQVTMMFAPFQTALPYIKAGRLRAIGVASPRRSALMPELPTIAELGVPRFEALSWYALMVPAGTPAEVVERIQGIVAKLMAKPETRQQLATLGMDPGGGPPSQLAATIASETARWTDVVKKQNIKPE
jgi:tripartite-type tricarboxylate transporter receptor subunit TctC